MRNAFICSVAVCIRMLYMISRTNISAFAIPFTVLIGLLGCDNTIPTKVTEQKAKSTEQNKDVVLPPALADSDILKNPDGTNAPGRWRRVATPTADYESELDFQEKIEELDALGYLGGVTLSSGRSGVTRYQPDQVFHGYNFYTSGHKAMAVLMALDGRILHTWEKKYEDVWPDIPSSRIQKGFWSRAHLYENGDILAIYSGFGMVRLDKDSNILWVLRNHAHHDINVMEDGSFYVLSNDIRVVPSISTFLPIVEDFITHVSSDGVVTRVVSLFECFENSLYDSLMKRVPPNEIGDLFHTNSLEQIDDRIASKFEHAEKGQFLVSIRNRSMLAIVDIEKKTVVWATTGSWRHQHFAKALPGGNILFFDNRGILGESRIHEYSLVLDQIVWSYAGSEKEPFYTETSGSCFRLSNGNLLITETDKGRAFELNSENEVVWEFWNPERAGDDREFIANLLAVTRIEPSYTSTWLEANTNN